MLKRRDAADYNPINRRYSVSVRPPSLLLCLSCSLLSSPPAPLRRAAVALLPQWRGRLGPSGEEEEDDALTPPALLQVMERKEGVRQRGGREECCRSHKWITLAQ